MTMVALTKDRDAAEMLHRDGEDNDVDGINDKW